MTRGSVEHRIMRSISACLHRTGDRPGIPNSTHWIVNCLVLPLLIAAGASFFRYPNIGPVVVITAYLGNMLLIAGSVLNAESATRTGAITTCVPEHMER